MIKHLKKIAESFIGTALAPSPKLLKGFTFRKLKKSSGFYRKNEDLYFLERHLFPTDTFFDVGSNMGVYSYIAATILPASSIYIFEPIPFLNSRLKTMFGRSHVEQLALSDTGGSFEFKIPRVNGHLLDTRGTLETSFKESGEENAKLIQIETITFDSYVSEKKISKVDFLKIDVEGHELKVIEGAKNTIALFKPKLLIEIEKRHHSSHNELKLILDILLSLHYRMYYLDKKSWTVKEVEENHLDFIVSQHEGDGSYVNNFYFESLKG